MKKKRHERTKNGYLLWLSLPSKSFYSWVYRFFPHLMFFFFYELGWIWICWHPVFRFFISLLFMFFDITIFHVDNFFVQRLWVHDMSLPRLLNYNICIFSFLIITIVRNQHISRYDIQKCWNINEVCILYIEHISKLVRYLVPYLFYK